MPNFIQIYKSYRSYGMTHADARANTLQDAEPYTTPEQRVRLSYLIRKLGA